MRRSGWLAIVLAAAALAVALALAGTPAAADNSPVAPARLHDVNLDTATVLDLQGDMNTHRFTSAQLTSFYLNRIRQLNPALHAVIETNPEALSEAAASDARRRAHGGARPARRHPGSAQGQRRNGRQRAHDGRIVRSRR